MNDGTLKIVFIGVVAAMFFAMGWLMVRDRQDGRAQRAWCEEHGHRWKEFHRSGTVCVNKDGYLLVPDSV